VGELWLDSQMLAPGWQSPIMVPVLGQEAVMTDPSSSRTSARKRL
jgi:hypothetical protein